MSNYAQILSDLLKQRKQLLSELHRIESAIGALKSLNGSGTARPSSRKPRISAAGRRRIAAAQRARWARVRAGKAGK